MRGARHYRPDVPTRLKKCSEHIGDDCTLCCAVTPCAYCLELEIYGEPIKHGYAPESANHWTGTVDGHSFDAFWERNYQTDECEFVVELDDVEVYRKSCYEGQECRDSSDEAAVTIGYDEATLRWIKHEPLPLPHIIGDAGCPTWFCGECECSCECVCVTITEPDSTVITGELCNVAYECEGPRWEGRIGDYDLALPLGRDSYGNCVLESTINGEAQDAVSVTGCKDMSTTITLYDGTTIDVACKICSCDAGQWPCCDGIGTPDALYLTLTTISMICSCLNGQVITLYPTDDLNKHWEAVWQWPCTDLFFPENVTWFRFRVFCDVGNAFSQLYINSIKQLDTDPEPDPDDSRWVTSHGTFIYDATEGQCDPFYFKYSDPAGTGGNVVWVRCQDDFMDNPEIEIELTL